MACVGVDGDAAICDPAGTQSAPFWSGDFPMLPSILTFTCYIEREDDQYVATIADLDVSSYGDTIDEAMRRVGDALALYLETLAEDGELEMILRQQGILKEQRRQACVDRPGLFVILLSLPVPTPA